MGANNTLRKVVPTPLLTNNSQNILSFLLNFFDNLKVLFMEAEKNVASFLNPNVHLDRFDGTNFTRWKGLLFFLLTVLKIVYVLDPNLEPIPEPTDYEPAERRQNARSMRMTK